MKILAFDTSSTAISVALQNEEHVECVHEIAPLKHAQRILSIIQSILKNQRLDLCQLDALAFGCGPGSFTGIRIGSSVAQGLGMAIKLPIIRVSSLAILAQTALLEQQWSNLLIALDARMNQVYWAQYQANDEGCVELVGEEQVIAPAQTLVHKPINSLLNKELYWYGLGDGWEKYPSILNKHPVYMTKASQLPNARALLSLAQLKLKKGEWVSSSDAIPNYLR